MNRSTVANSIIAALLFLAAAMLMYLCFDVLNNADGTALELLILLSLVAGVLSAASNALDFVSEAAYCLQDGDYSADPNEG
jgi:DMSO reductase anchor subunit